MRPLLITATMLGATTLVACGSGSRPTISGGSGHFAALLAFSQCMNTHGVPNFPDASSGGGIESFVPSSVDAGSPAFQRAANACGGP